jgi:hypothetical protein
MDYELASLLNEEVSLASRQISERANFTDFEDRVEAALEHSGYKPLRDDIDKYRLLHEEITTRLNKGKAGAVAAVDQREYDDSIDRRADDIIQTYDDRSLSQILSIKVAAAQFEGYVLTDVGLAVDPTTSRQPLTSKWLTKCSWPPT